MLCIAAGLLVFAADPEFAVDVCGPQVWMNHAGVKVASQTGKLGADDAIMIEITKTDLTANWVGVGLHGGHMDTEMYVAYWDSDIVVVHNYFSTSDSFPSVPSDTPVTIYYTDSTSVRFYRKMYNPEGVHTNPIQRGIAMIFSWAKGQGQPGAGWTTHGTTNETRGTGQVIPAGSDVCTHPQNSSFVPSSCGFAVVDTYIDLSLNVGMYDEEPAVAFHWNMILPTTAPPYNWIGFGFQGENNTCDMYVTNFDGYVGNFLSTSWDTKPQAWDDSVIVDSTTTIQQHESRQIVNVTFIRLLDTGESKTANLTSGENVTVVWAFGSGNPDPNVDSWTQHKSSDWDRLTLGIPEWNCSNITPSSDDSRGSTTLGTAGVVVVCIASIVVIVGVFVWFRFQTHAAHGFHELGSEGFTSVGSPVTCNDATDVEAE
ncbi:hypothetical protein DIPPA_52184 [Diplonema papillatum]|nr:hypothetical protein DIPPA_52184 [Diplonema papillatum]